MNHLLTVYQIGGSDRPPKFPARRTEYLPGAAYSDGALPHVGQGCCKERHNMDDRLLSSSHDLYIYNFIIIYYRHLFSLLKSTY